MAMNETATVPVGKILCCISGKLRPDKPEEHIRQRWARSLAEEYKYSREDMAIEYTIVMGTDRKRADIVIFRPNAPHRQDSIHLIVECKRPNISKSDKDKGVEQLKSYMSASSCQFGLWVGEERIAYEKLEDGSIEETTDVPSHGAKAPTPPDFNDLVPAIDLTSSLRRCHNYIYANEGLQKAEAFHELQKLIFCKVLDEYESTTPLQFFVAANERRSIAGEHRLTEDRIGPLFDVVKSRYPYIFPNADSIQLRPRVLSYIVAELQRYTLLRTNTDVKGAAYEELVGENLRGDRGEFFTPRNVCDMTVRMALSLFPVANLSTMKILDCCCGTGGFLVSTINKFREVFLDFELQRGGSLEEVTIRLGGRIKDLAERNLFGMDINPFLVRTTQMNLVMHGDGSANIFQGDSLAAPGEWQDEGAQGVIAHGGFDLCITNPPFGSSALVDDPHTLSQYQLTTFEADSPRAALPTEQLFVEAALRYVRPGGILAIVLPDSILNNPSLAFIRRWILLNARIVASIDLPKETFAEGGGVPNPSVILLQRLTEYDRRLAAMGQMQNYNIFMSIPKKVGRDKRGNPLYSRSPEGLRIFDSARLPILDDQLPEVSQSFALWQEESGINVST